MKNKIYTILTKPYIVVLTMAIAPLFSVIDRNFAYFFGLGVALLILWGSGYDWSRFGYAERIHKKMILKNVLIAILLVLVFYTVSALLQLYFGKVDISSLDDLRNNFVGYLITLVIVWIFAAFGEELLFRSYYMRQLAILFGNTNKAWFFAAVIVAIYFGVSHSYQGTSGMIGAGLWHFCVSMIFRLKKNNLASTVLIHGFYDTIGLTLLFFSKERILADWIQQLF